MLNNGKGLIVLPGNPFLAVFRRFGSGECAGLILAFFATFALSQALDSSIGTELTEVILGLGISINLAFVLVGLIPEKLGFFILPLHEARRAYISRIDESLSRHFFLKTAFRDGSMDMTKDVFGHDIIYCALMYSWLYFFPNIVEEYVVAPFAFVIAFVIVVRLEVIVIELLYKHCKKRLLSLGFGSTSYLESRFHFDSIKNAQIVFDTLMRKHHLGTVTDNIFHEGSSAVINYHDKYVGGKKSLYNKRKLRLRFHKRDLRSGKGASKSIQIVFTRVNQMAKKETSQFNYYPIQKDKLYFKFTGKMCWNIVDIISDPVRKFLEKFQKNTESYEVKFQRQIANNPNTMLVSIDKPGDVTILEIKVYNSQKKLLKEAMRIAMNAGESQTTHSKQRIMDMSAV